MKIGIDISQLAYPGTGVATYTENLVKNLLKIDKQNEYVLFYSSLRKKLSVDKFQIPIPKSQTNFKFQISNFKFPPILLETIWNKAHILPIEALVGRLDLYHTSDWLEPPSKCPKITTIHDLTIYKYPESFMPRGGHNIVENMKRKLDWVKKESKIIIAVSENTKKDIINFLGISENRIKVVYEAADEIYNKEHTTKNKETIKEKYGILGKYILAVGTREPRKNIKRIMQAHQLLSAQFPDLSLIIAGKYGWGDDLAKFQIPNSKSQIRLLGYVPKEDLAELYAGAECFVYPSLYEGFGLPVLEAMASSCPVVTSNLSSLPEVAGDAGILVDPNKVEDIAEGIKEALSAQKSLIKKGLSQFSKFSWEKNALQTLEIYKNLLA